MNLQKLFEAQRKLGKVGLFNYKGEDRFNKLVLALLVELGECANEWRGFKFWSKDQEPRTKVQIHKSASNGPFYKNPLLEEYVDGLHFVLELGIELGFSNQISNIKPIQNQTIEQQFIWINVKATALINYQSLPMYQYLVANYIGLGEMLGFTWEQIEQAYFEKHEINIERQENGY
ncbi:dUTP diphosphatase [Peribacillus acanthi]|uniref:dUTP diphosphatase n=1 Tax=Peribacillus acanthi TaxID=2171554 RepID=UPI000D3E1D0D|nr:dUTP diphosphatase [Peribacillus acanthi]